MSNKALKIYKGIRASAPPASPPDDKSGWTERLGFSLHDGLRRALEKIETDPQRLERILQLTHGYVSYLAATNDLFVGRREGYSAAISFRKKNNPGNKGEARVAVRTPDNHIVFVTFSGKPSKLFQGFDDPNRGFNYWWWKKESRHWVGRLHSVPEVNTIGNVRQFYNGNPRIILPGEFWDHVAKTPETIIELLADAVTRAYYANRTDPAMNLHGFQRNDRKAYRKKILFALMETLQTDLSQGLEEQLKSWRGDVQLGSAVAEAHTRQYPYSYGTVRFFSECNAEVCERRHTFAQTFPFVIPILSRGQYFLHDTRNLPKELRRIFLDYARDWLAVIDANDKFVQRAAKDLSTCLEVPVLPALVKRASGLPMEFATDQNVLLVLTNLKHLAALPFHCIPTDPHEFISFAKGVEKCTPLLDVIGQNMATVVKHAGKNLTGDMARIGEQSSAANHLKDYIDSVIGKIVLAWAARYATEQGKELDASMVQSCSELSRDSILQKAVQSRSALRLIEGSERWHKGGHQNNFVNRNQTFMQLAEGNTDWPAITEEATAPNGFKLVPLTSNLDLQEEGKLLSHCVGGYGWQCISSNSHIVSLQNKDGHHISTLQIRDQLPQHGDVKFEQGLITVIQHQAHKNTTPPKECVDAAAWYVERICTGKIEISLTAIREARSEMDKAKARNLISQKIGYHPEQSDKAEELYVICRDFLPHDWSKATLDATVKAFGVIDAIKARVADIPVTLNLPHLPSAQDEAVPPVVTNG